MEHERPFNHWGESVLWHQCKYLKKKKKKPFISVLNKECVTSFLMVWSRHMSRSEGAETELWEDRAVWWNGNRFHIIFCADWIVPEMFYPICTFYPWHGLEKGWAVVEKPQSACPEGGGQVCIWRQCPGLFLFLLPVFPQFCLCPFRPAHVSWSDHQKGGYTFFVKNTYERLFFFFF